MQYSIYFKVLPIVIVLLVIALFVTYAGLMKQNNRKKVSNAKSVNKRFHFYSTFPLTRKIFKDTYKQITTVGNYQLIEGRNVAVKLYEQSLLVAVIVFIFGAFTFNDIIMSAVIFLLAIIVVNVSLRKRVDDISYNALRQTRTFLGNLSQSYTRLHNIPDALNDTPAPPLISASIKEIYAICTSKNSLELLDAFIQKCPNRILRTVATACYVRNEAGDYNIPGKQPPFKVALSLIRDEVAREVTRLLNQKLRFAMLDKIPLVPLFVSPLLIFVMTKILTSTTSVFEGAVGYVVKLVITVVSMISYYTVSTINSPSVAASDDRIKLLTSLLQRAEIKKFAATLVPASFKTRLKVNKKLTGCLSSKDITYLYFEKFIFAVIALVFTVIASISVLVNARSVMLNSVSSPSLTSLTTYTAEELQNVKTYEKKILISGKLPEDKVLTDFYTKTFVHSPDVNSEDQISRLKLKFSMYQNLHFKFWFAFIYIGSAVVGFLYPNFSLNLRVRLVKSESAIDVMQMQTVICILMDTNLDTLEVLKWLSRTSDLHKAPLTHCMHEYTRNPLEALGKLKSKSSDIDFINLVTRLESTAYTVGLEEAFDDLITERDIMLRERDAILAHDLDTRRALAGPVALGPIMVMIVGIFIVPLVIVAYYTFLSTSTQLQGIS